MIASWSIRQKDCKEQITAGGFCKALEADGSTETLIEFTLT